MYYIITPMNPNPRPRRRTPRLTSFELTPAGRDTARRSALRAMQHTEEAYADITAEAQEGRTISPAVWDALAADHAAAQQLLRATQDAPSITP